MANPQKENGYTAIANELMEAIARIRMPGKTVQILFVILRKTYGFNKKEDAISLSQFSLATGMPKPHVSNCLAKLKNMKIIHITKNDKGHTTKYRLNKDYSDWKPLLKTVTKNKTITKNSNVTENSNKPLLKTVTTKDTITKEELIGGTKRFTPPTPEQVTSYAKSIDYELDGVYFCHWYQTRGWMAGKNKMKDWKSAVVTWKIKEKEKFRSSNVDPNNRATFIT